ncbi:MULTISPECIES: MBL fold metallo-hydrolase [unclassified Mesorhizobium]|uniref:MBL fold metallo-hydrolase n=1 Tax=unclassified Mesorhizobium TaxID=325217 RepID=UPI0013DF8504|nr:MULTISPECIES: MBL fold metallo-hydrolase [unclassified Mesorhizobium]
MTAFQIGTIRIDQIVEMENVTVPAKWLLANISDFYPEIETFEINIQSFLIRTGKNTILVDSGCGDGRSRPGQPQFEGLTTGFLQKLALAGPQVDDIDLVILTHLHFDHVGWNTNWVDGAWRPTFPRARYLFSRNEYEFWGSAQWTGIGSEATRQSFRDSVQPVVDAGQADFLEALEDIRRFDPEIALLPLPGHTPYQFGIAVESMSERAVIVADALHSPLQISEPRLYNGGDMDRELALRTRQTLIRDHADTGTLLFGSHVGGSSAGCIVSGDGGPRFVEWTDA